MPQHLRVLLSLPAVLKVGWFKMNHPTSAPCVNLPLAAFSQLWTELAARPFSFSEKKQKRLPAGSRKDDENEWQFIIWKQKL